MTTRHSTPTSPAIKPVRAALYFRMSTDRQEHSIDRQKSQVEPYAERMGFQVVQTYTDEGISGWKEGLDRPDFSRMLKDAQLGKFDVIVVDDIDRFGRFDQITYGYIVEPLRRRGVTLRTVRDGLIDWVNSTPMLVESIKMGSRKDESATLSRRVATRAIQLSKVGKWISGTAPYGYVRHPDTGKLAIGRLEDLPQEEPEETPAEEGENKKKRKPILDDETHAKHVRFMFEFYATKDVSVRGVLEEMHERGVRSPTGKEWWTPMTVNKVLRNRAYVGDLVWNKASASAFNSVKGGQVIPQGDRTGKWRRNEEDQWVIVPNSHPAIIDRDLFLKVQAKLAGNQKRTTPLPDRGGFLLSGLMTCGHCGNQMHARSKYRGEVRTSYECKGYCQWGLKVCKRNRVREDLLVNGLVRKIQQDYLNPANMEKLREEIKRQADAERKESPSEAAGLRRKIRELDQEIGVRVERVGVAPPDMAADMYEVIRKRRSEKGILERRLQEVDRGIDVAAEEKEIVRAEAYLWELREALDRSDPAELRMVLREIVGRIELFWDHTPRGPQTVCTFARGLIYLKGDEQVIRLVNHGSPSGQASGRGG